MSLIRMIVPPFLVPSYAPLIFSKIFCFIMCHLQSSCFDFKALAENMKNSRLLGLFWTGKTLSYGQINMVNLT